MQKTTAFRIGEKFFDFHYGQELPDFEGFFTESAGGTIFRTWLENGERAFQVVNTLV